MKTFTWSYLVTTVTLAVFNFWVDPTHQWRQKSFDFQRNWNTNQIWVSPPQLNERWFRANHLHLIQKPDLLFLGSSRVSLVNSSMFKTSVHLYNCSLSGAAVEDYIWIWQLLKELDKRPQNLVIFFDPYILNENAGQVRWRSNSEWVDNFLDARELQGSARQKRWMHFRSRMVYGMHRATDLFRAEALWYSFLEFKRRWLSFSPHYDGQVIKSFQAPSVDGYFPDGAFRYPDSYQLPETIPDIRTRILNETGGSLYALSNWKLDPREIHLLKLLITDMRTAGVKIQFIIPPYPPKVVKDFSSREGYQSIMSESLNALSEVIDHDSGVLVCNDYDNQSSQCSELEFYDSMHPAESCVHKTIDACFRTHSQWASLIPTH